MRRLRRHALFEHLELAAADARPARCSAVVVADLRVLVVRRGIARLGGQLARVVDQLSVVGDQHAAARGGDDLVAVEGEDAGLAETSPAARPL